MAIPSVTVNVNPQGITIIPPAGGNVPLLLGTAAAGNFGQIQTLANRSGVINSLSDGPLADKAALDLSYGAAQVLAWRMFSGSVVGTALASGATIQRTNKAGSTAGTGTVGFKGAAGTLTPVILITTSSSVSAFGAFDYSLDGGNSYTGSPTTILTGVTEYALGSSGIKVELSAATETAGLWVAGDSYAAGGVYVGTAGSGTVAVSGSPVAPYGNQIGSSGVYNGVIVQITTSSTASVPGQFNYSLDGGNTWSAAQVIPVGLTYAIPNTGLTLTFSAQLGTGVWVSGDTIRAPITAAVGVMYPTAQSAFTLLQVGATGAVASAKGAGTFGPGSTAALGLTWLSTPKVYGNDGTGVVAFYGAIGSKKPYVVITTSSSGSVYGDFDYSLNGGALTGTPQAIPAAGTPVQLGTSGIWAAFNGAKTVGLFVAGDEYAVALPSPVDEYSLVIKITADGTAENGACQYVVSFDGGVTFGPTQIMTSAAINLGHGVELTATDYGGAGGTAGFKAGDVYSFQTLPPPFTDTDVANVTAIVQGAPQAWGWVHVLGHSISIANMQSMFGQLNTSMGLWWAGNRFGAMAVMESPPDTTLANIDAALVSESASLSSDYIMVGAGDAAVVSPITGFQLARNAAWLASARMCAAPLGQDLADVSAGALSGVTQLYRDENQTPGLDAVRYTTLRTLTGIQGFYLTNGNMFAPSGDDIYLAQFRRIIDEAAQDAYSALAQILNSSVRVIAGGTIDLRDAKAIEARVAGAVMQKLRGQISGLSVQVDTAHDILADATLPVTVSITPLGYLKTIDVTLAFSNDALSALAA